MQKKKKNTCRKAGKEKRQNGKLSHFSHQNRNTSSDKIYVYCSYIHQTGVYKDLCNAGSQEPNPSLNPAHITIILYNYVIQMYTLEPKCTLPTQKRGWQNT